MCYNRPNLKISPGQNNQGIKHPPWTKCPPGLVVLQPLLCQPNQSLLQEPIQNLGYFLNFRMSFTRPLGWQTSSRTDIQLKDIQLNRHPAAEWKSSRRIWHCHLHLFSPPASCSMPFPPFSPLSSFAFYAAKPSSPPMVSYSPLLPTLSSLGSNCFQKLSCRPQWPYVFPPDLLPHPDQRPIRPPPSTSDLRCHPSSIWRHRQRIPLMIIV